MRTTVLEQLISPPDIGTVSPTSSTCFSCLKQALNRSLGIGYIMESVRLHFMSSEGEDEVIGLLHSIFLSYAAPLESAQSYRSQS